LRKWLEMTLGRFGFFYRKAVPIGDYFGLLFWNLRLTCPNSALLWTAFTEYTANLSEPSVTSDGFS
jgi:hypothetical protein